MPRAIIDPDEVKSFSSFLNAMVEELGHESAEVRAAYAHLHEYWRDQKYERFNRRLFETLTHLERFIRHGELYAEQLRGKAAQAQRYLDNQY